MGIAPNKVTKKNMLRRNNNGSTTLNLHRFKALFGISDIVCLHIWVLLKEQGKLP